MLQSRTGINLNETFHSFEMLINQLIGTLILTIMILMIPVIERLRLIEIDQLRLTGINRIQEKELSAMETTCIFNNSTFIRYQGIYAKNIYFIGRRTYVNLITY